ncbi:MAG TPA: class I SAM-dependent methyltransferase [Pseudonocardiaceae bacterium]|nr:class I SAM-dependent methyltransferase [Pseudonocardiaceae bacterium]
MTHADAVAPLAPNAWLRFDVITRMLPPGVRDVLEIGCGQGAVGARLAQRCSYVGIEPDETSYGVADARLRAMGRGEVRHQSSTELGDERFDLVCAFEVLEHVEDDAAALTEWASHLRPGGWLLLSVPAHQQRFGPWDEIVGHYLRYSPADITELLHRTGFTDVEVRQYGMPLGYLLETVRDAIGKRRLGVAENKSFADRTAGSGRLYQPAGALRGTVIRWATAPFRVVQRAFPSRGVAIVVRARLA